MMRTGLLVLAFVCVCATSAALAQARVLIAPSPVPLPDEQTSGKDAASHEQEATPARAQGEQPAGPREQAPNEMAGAGSEPADAGGRFRFERVKNGVLRLDRMGGEVSFCQPDGTGWVCAAVPQDRAALEKEIEQLRDEVASLKKEIASLNAPPLPPRPPQTVPPTPEPDKAAPTHITLPTTEDVARARAYIVDTWHRLVEMIENWQKGVLRKT